MGGAKLAAPAAALLWRDCSRRRRPAHAHEPARLGRAQTAHVDHPVSGSGTPARRASAPQIEFFAHPEPAIDDDRLEAIGLEPALEAAERPAVAALDDHGVDAN